MGFFKKLKDGITAPDAIVELKLSDQNVALGQSIQGTLHVSSKEVFDATEVRYEIQCTERARVIRNVYEPGTNRSVPKEVEETKILFETKPQLFGPTHFTSGEVRDFPLTFSISPAALPSYVDIDKNVTWSIKGVVAAHHRPDRTSPDLSLTVFQSAAQPVTVEKEVVRQVVMIPCKYCGALMDETATVCPNCGAKRTL
jgi:hypothetical protein